MHDNDRQAIEGVFARLTEVSRNAPPRDRDAEMYINQKMQATDGAAYFLAQTVVVQEQALEAAQARIADLEYALQHQARQKAQPQGGFLSRVFGGQPAQSPLPPQRPMPQQAHYQGQGGGFLAGAAQTAVGVAGGMMLGNMLGSMFAGEAQAAEPMAEEFPEEEAFAAPEEEMDFGEW